MRNRLAQRFWSTLIIIMICCSSLYAQIDPPPPPDGGGGPGGVNDVFVNQYLCLFFIIGFFLGLAKLRYSNINRP